MFLSLIVTIKQTSFARMEGSSTTSSISRTSTTYLTAPENGSVPSVSYSSHHVQRSFLTVDCIHLQVMIHSTNASVQTGHVSPRISCLTMRAASSSRVISGWILERLSYQVSSIRYDVTSY